MIVAREPDRSETNIAGRNRNPLRFLSLAWLITVVVLAAFMAGAVDSFLRFEYTTLRASRIQTLRGRIVHLDEVLTMSARMAAATGDPSWEERYHRNEAELDAAIQEATALVPDAASSGKAGAANIALVELEGRAFTLVRQGRLNDAQAILSGPQYAAEKTVYADGMLELGRTLDKAIDQAVRAQRRRTTILLGAGGVAIVLLVIGWVVVLRIIKRWRADLAEKHARLLDELVWRKSAEEELTQHRDRLEVLVAQRTAELHQANESMRRDLEAGAEYVRGLLAAPVRDRVHIDWRYIPSSNLGGDTIGHHWIDSDHLALFLIDVVGHGLDSALFSVTIMNVIRSGSLRNADLRQPGEVLAELNNVFQGERHGGKYFTIWYGVYCVSERTLRWSGGGHHPAMLYESGRAEPVQLQSQGLMMGVLPGEEYLVDSCRVEPDARLFIFSDGAFEIIRNDKLVWSLDGLTAYIAGLVIRKSEVMDPLHVHVQELGGSTQLGDDFTIIEVMFP